MGGSTGMSKGALDIRRMSVWSVAIGLELGAESLGLARTVRFWCLDCLGERDPREEAAITDQPWARECMGCTSPREPIVMAVFDRVMDAGHNGKEARRA